MCVFFFSFILYAFSIRLVLSTISISQFNISIRPDYTHKIGLSPNTLFVVDSQTNLGSLIIRRFSF